MARNAFFVGLLSAALLITACGGGGGGGSSNPPPPPSVTAPSALSYTSPQVYTVNTAITALSPTVTGTVTGYSVAPALPAGLQISASSGQISGTPTAATAQATYVVTATNSAGSTNFSLVMTVNGTFTVGGTVSGLTGAGLALSNNGGANLAVATNGAFTFATPLATGATYAVIITAQPTGQTCVLAQGSGTVGSANVTAITVTCTNIVVTPTYTVGGTVSGLTGAGLVLRNNGGGDLPVANNGGFTFVQSLNGGAAYLVTVFTQPAGQTCSVAQGSGNIGSANVTNVAVTCVAVPPPTYSIGGSVSGLAGGSVVLRNNGGDDLSVGANGNFTFATRLTSGSNYSVTVATNPAGKSCVVGLGTGTVGSVNVTSVVVLCADSLATIGGTVIGLSGTGLKISNGLDELTINASGPFTFSTQYGPHLNYHVVVTQAPSSPAQTCAIVNGIGVTTTSPVTNISILCVNTPSGGKFVYVPNYFASNISAWQVNQSTGTLSSVVGGPFASGAQLTQLVAHPNGKFLYGRAAADNNIRAYAINQTASPVGGALTNVAGSPFAEGDNSGPVYIDRSGKWLAIVSTTVPSLSMYSINGTTGVLTAVPGSPYTLNYTPGSVIFRPDSKFVYVADPGGNEGFGYAINSTTGALTALSTPFFTSGNSLSDLAIDASGRFFYGSTLQGTMYVGSIDNVTGAITPVGVGNTQVGNSPRTITIDPTGRFLYVVLSSLPNPGGIAQFTINQTTGVISSTGPSPVVGTGTGGLQTSVAIRTDGRFIYASTLLTDLVYALEIDSTDGQLYTVPGHPFATETGPNPPVMDPAGRLVYVSSGVNNNLTVYSSDLATGALTPIPGSPFPAGNGPIGVVVVP